MNEQNQQQTLPPQQPQIPPQNVSPVPPPPQHKNWIKWVLIIVFVVLLASITTYFVLTFQSQKPPPPQIVQTTPTPKPQVAKTNQATLVTPILLPSKASATGGDPTANWKTYTNTKYNYSVRYPPEWNVYELVAHRDFEVSSTIESDRVNFAKDHPFPKNDYWIWVSVVPNANQLSTEQVVDNYLNEIPKVVSSITKDYLTVSGTNAIGLYPVPSATDTKHVYAATKENIYSIVLQAGSLPDLNQEAMNTFNMMVLSTFKFSSK